jgi:hypothetical protein
MTAWVHYAEIHLINRSPSSSLSIIESLLYVFKQYRGGHHDQVQQALGLASRIRPKDSETAHERPGVDNWLTMKIDCCTYLL